MNHQRGPAVAVRRDVDPGPYPDTRAARDRWVRALRPAVEGRNGQRTAHWFLERERNSSGFVDDVLTVLLRNRECPWKCLFCDLWKDTLTEPVAVGEIPSQITEALNDPSVLRLHPAQVKLYNAGSFFDPGAIPEADYPRIAELVRPFSRVIVESHPALISDRCWRFHELLRRDRDAVSEPMLEVAMGLETVHESVLEKLNKGVTLKHFARAAASLRDHGIAWRAFILVQPPFEAPNEAVSWAVRSAQFAFDHGADVVSLIAVRGGNGALEFLRAQGHFTEPALSSLEQAIAGALALGKGRVFADLWELPTTGACNACFTVRRQRLEQMNHSQIVLPRTPCAHCGE